MNPRYLSELELLADMPKVAGKVLDPRTLNAQQQEEAKEAWRAFLSRHIQRLSGGLVDALRAWAYAPPTTTAIKEPAHVPAPQAAKSAWMPYADDTQETPDDDSPPL